MFKTVDSVESPTGSCVSSTAEASLNGSIRLQGP